MSKKLIFSVGLKDCRVEAMRSSKGAGGQHRDKTSSAIRITHIASGATGFSQDHREQPRNKKEAFRRMAESPRFKAWVRMKALDLEPIEDIVERHMKPENIRTEFKNKGKWEVVE